MRSLAKPDYDARSTFELCIENIRDDDFREKLKSVADDIETAETTYIQLGQDAQLFTIAEAGSIAGTVTSAEMGTLYKGTFSRQDTPPRAIYDEIKAAPTNSICPLCGHRVVTTLDHYLAKSRHPALAVTPVNLVPACSDCNKLKLNRQPAQASDQTLHPYFDNVDDEVWLVAGVKEIGPPVVEFEAAPPPAWPELKGTRLRNHFRVFQLAELYSIQAAVELVNMRDNLEMIAERGGAAGVQKHLEEQAGSRRKVANNSWQSATYEALAKSDWFCTTGFTLIPR
jgi:5-methylcytosine-specific restriction endonuclease McrA